MAKIEEITLPILYLDITKITIIHYHFFIFLMNNKILL